MGRNFQRRDDHSGRDRSSGPSLRNPGTEHPELPHGASQEESGRRLGVRGSQLTIMLISTTKLWRSMGCGKRDVLWEAVHSIPRADLGKAGIGHVLATGIEEWDFCGRMFPITGWFVFLSWFLIFVFEVHDKVYERYFIRWRYFYDLDLILPTLTRPFGPALDPQCFDTAGGHLYQFMKPNTILLRTGNTIIRSAKT